MPERHSRGLASPEAAVGGGGGGLVGCRAAILVVRDDPPGFEGEECTSL